MLANYQEPTDLEREERNRLSFTEIPQPTFWTDQRYKKTLTFPSNLISCTLILYITFKLLNSCNAEQPQNVQSIFCVHYYNR